MHASDFLFYPKNISLISVMVAVREFRGDGAENLNISKLRHRHKTSDKNWVYSIFQINSLMTMIMPMMLMARKIVILLIMRIGIGEDDIKDVDGNSSKNNLNDDERKRSATCSTHTLVVKICRLISTPITCVFTLLL